MSVCVSMLSDCLKMKEEKRPGFSVVLHCWLIFKSIQSQILIIPGQNLFGDLKRSFNVLEGDEAQRQTDVKKILYS